jgi:hypothetical protein
MKQTITQFTFIDEMRADPYSDFSREALEAIYQYIEQLEQEMGGEMEFRCADIRMMFDEYKDEAEAIEQANYDPTGWNDGTFIQLPGGGFVVAIY